MIKARIFMHFVQTLKIQMCNIWLGFAFQENMNSIQIKKQQRIIRYGTVMAGFQSIKKFMYNMKFFKIYIIHLDIGTLQENSDKGCIYRPNVRKIFLKSQNLINVLNKIIFSFILSTCFCK